PNRSLRGPRDADADGRLHHPVVSMHVPTHSGRTFLPRSTCRSPHHPSGVSSSLMPSIVCATPFYEATRRPTSFNRRSTSPDQPWVPIARSSPTFSSTPARPLDFANGYARTRTSRALAAYIH